MTISETTQGRLEGRSVITQYVLAGKATFTVRNEETGNRFTFRVIQLNKDVPHFVAVLTGDNNDRDYSFLGTIFNGLRYRHGRRSRIQATAQSAKVFDYFWRHLVVDQLPEQIEVWHEGQCGRCGRTLTVPESIATGIGPICAGVA